MAVCTQVRARDKGKAPVPPTPTPPRSTSRDLRRRARGAGRRAPAIHLVRQDDVVAGRHGLVDRDGRAVARAAHVAVHALKLDVLHLRARWPRRGRAARACGPTGSGTQEARQHAAPRTFLSVSALPARLEMGLLWTAAESGSSSTKCSRSRTASAGLLAAGARATPGAGCPLPSAQRTQERTRPRTGRAPRQSPPRPTGPRRPARRTAARPQTLPCRSRLPPPRTTCDPSPAATVVDRCADAAHSRRTHPPHARAAAGSVSTPTAGQRRASGPWSPADPMMQRAIGTHVFTPMRRMKSYGRKVKIAARRTHAPLQALDGLDGVEVVAAVARALQRRDDGVLLEARLQVLERQLHRAQALALDAHLRPAARRVSPRRAAFGACIAGHEHEARGQLAASSREQASCSAHGAVKQAGS